MGMRWAKRIAMILLVAGALNWGLVAFFNFDLVTFLSFGFEFIEVTVKGLVGIAGLYGLWLIGKDW